MSSFFHQNQMVVKRIVPYGTIGTYHRRSTSRTRELASRRHRLRNQNNTPNRTPNPRLELELWTTLDWPFFSPRVTMLTFRAQQSVRSHNRHHGLLPCDWADRFVARHSTRRESTLAQSLCCISSSSARYINRYPP